MKNQTLLWGAVLFWSAAVWAEEIPTITTVMENGPSENRINIVFLSEAYVTKHRETYFSDVRIAADSLFQFTPFKEYKNYFNVYAIWVASQDSFLSNVDWGEEPRTYFGQPGSFSSNDEKVEQTVRSFLAVSEPVVKVMLINDDRMTAGGVKGGMTIGTGLLHHDSDWSNRDYTRSFIHEFGHALGGLSDEYDGLQAFDAEQGRSFVNVTTETKRDRIRWSYWIEPDVPIPTPLSKVKRSWDGGVSYQIVDTSAYADKVGLFEGANLYSRGWYRPKLTCLMKELKDPLGVPPPFCEVCREALVLEIYRQVDPTGEIGLDVGESAAVFSINPPAPTDHNLKIQWLMDGNVVPRQNSSRLEVTDAGLGYGRHIVTVTVEDTTEWVRMDSVGFLVRSLEWRPIVYYPQPDFTGDGVVDFDDFFMFADVFGRPKTSRTEKFDLDWDGAIDFNDFFMFADSFGRRVSESRISIPPAQKQF